MRPKPIKSFKPIRRGTTWLGMDIKQRDPLNPGGYMDISACEITMHLKKDSDGPIEHAFTITRPDNETARVMPWKVDVEKGDYMSDLHIKRGDSIEGNTEIIMFPVLDVITYI